MLMQKEYHENPRAKWNVLQKQQRHNTAFPFYHHTVKNVSLQQKCSSPPLCRWISYFTKKNTFKQ